MSDNAQQPSPFTRPGFIAAAIVVVLILVAGGIAVVSGLMSPRDPEPTPTGTSPIISVEDESVCGLEGFETESTLTEAPDNEWELVGTVAAPTDPAVGPGVVDGDGFRSCFAHTAEGALYASVNFLALGTDANLNSRLIDLVAAGPGRDALEEEIESNPGSGPTNVRAQVAGFQIGRYDGATVTVDLALNYSDGRLVSVPLQLTWEDGDWKMVVTDTGELPLSPVVLQSLGGYIPWSGA